ncbi:MAG: ABC transporter ATP-binding protein [Gammaproteobacteria bacterium]
MDEPLSNLDAKLREEMRVELRELLNRLHITTLYVTHDQLEALTMSDRVAVMNAGSILQEGLPRQLYQSPADAFVARFIGQANLLRGRLCGIRENGCGTVKLKNRLLECLLSKSVAAEAEVLVMIRPEDVVLWGESERPPKNFLQGKVESACFIGDSLDCMITTEDERIRIRVHPSNVVERGQCISLYFPPERCRCVPL